MTKALQQRSLAALKNAPGSAAAVRTVCFKSQQLLRSAPYFPVADLEQSAAHYERVLGYHREYSGGTPPQIAIRQAV